MAIERKEKKVFEKIKYDTTGVDGNAYFILGFTQNLIKKIGLDDDDILNKMKAKDYTHLLQVFNYYFGDFVDLLLTDEEYNKWDDLYFKKFDFYANKLTKEKNMKIKIENNHRLDKSYGSSDDNPTVIGKKIKNRKIIVPNEIEDIEEKTTNQVKVKIK